MSRKNETDILKTVIGAALAAASVLLVWLLKTPRFRNIVPVLIIASIIAFVVETLLLFLLKSKNFLIKTVKILLLLTVNIIVFTCAVIYSFSPAVILRPHSDDESYEALKETPEAEEISFEGENGLINGWFYNAAGEGAPTVLYFYGNYETASTRLLQLIKSPSATAFEKCNFAVFDYPAYGKSEGKCTDAALLSFSLDVFDELSKRADNIIVLGYSVGTGPATYLASQRDVDALILYAPYANGIDLYNNVINIFKGSLERLVAFNIESEKYAENIIEKTLIIASKADELIPFASSEKLGKKFVDVNFVEATGISHNDFLSSSFVKEETERFIFEVTER